MFTCGIVLLNCFLKHFLAPQNFILLSVGAKSPPPQKKLKIVQIQSCKKRKNQHPTFFFTQNISTKNARFTAFLNSRLNSVYAFKISKQHQCQLLVALVLATLVLFAGSTGATSTRASSTSATFIKTPVLPTVFCMLCPKISTGLEKLAQPVVHHSV